MNPRTIQTISFCIFLIFITLAFVASADCGLRSKNKLVKLPMAPVQQPVIIGGSK